jgi:site-specific DNA-methyltransferase (adenine-specific)
MVPTATLHLGDCMRILPTLPNASVDAIITDPPYGFFRKEMPYDQPPDPTIWSELYRIAKPNAYLAIFSRMPILAEWHAHIAAAGWKYSEHIVWCKRYSTPTNTGLRRIHESILIYRKGRAQYHDLYAPWWDTVLPTLPHGGVDLQTVERAITEIQTYMRTGLWRNKGKGTGPWHYRGTPAIHTGKYIARPCNWSKMRLGNLWSFSIYDEHRQRPKQHPHQKPVALLERLVKLLAAEGHTILDPFMGSGTTGVAALKLKRHFIGIELQPDFYNLAKQRIQSLQEVNIHTHEPPNPK